MSRAPSRNGHDNTEQPLTQPGEERQAAMKRYLADAGIDARLPEHKQPPARHAARVNLEALEDLPPLSWVVEDIIALGCTTIIHGDPKSGKSTLTGYWMGHNANWCGKTINTDATWWVYTEEGDYALRARLHRNGITNDTHHVFFQKPVVTDDEEWTTQGLVNEIYTDYHREDEIEQPAVIVIDTMLHWSDHADYNDAGQVALVLAPLLSLQKLLPDCAIVVLHQTRKAGGMDEVSGALGSQQITASFDLVGSLQRVGSKGGGKLKATGRLLESAYEVEFTTSMADGLIAYAVGTASNAFQDFVLDTLADEPGTLFTATALRNLYAETGTEIESRTANRHLTELVSKGLINQPSNEGMAKMYQHRPDQNNRDSIGQTA